MTAEDVMELAWTKYERKPRKPRSCWVDMNGKSLKTRLKRFHQTPAALFLLYFNVRIIE